MPLGFTSPRTWVALELVTAAMGNTHWRDQFNSLANARALYARDVSIQDVVSSASETTVFSTTITGGDLSTTRQLALSLVGDYLNNTGGQDTLTVRVKYGGTTFFTTTVTLSQSANRRGLDLTFLLSAANSASAQYSKGKLSVGLANTASGDAGTVGEEFDMVAVHNAGAVSSGTDQTFAVTFQLGTNSASISGRCLCAVLELISIVG